MNKERRSLLPRMPGFRVPPWSCWSWPSQILIWTRYSPWFCACSEIRGADPRSEHTEMKVALLWGGSNLTYTALGYGAGRPASSLRCSIGLLHSPCMSNRPEASEVISLKDIKDLQQGLEYTWGLQRWSLSLGVIRQAPEWRGQNAFLFQRADPKD